MTVDELIEELTAYSDLGHGREQVYWFNLESEKEVEVEDVATMPDRTGILID